MKQKFLYLFLLQPIFITGCIDEPEFDTTSNCYQEISGGIYVLNEGVWQQNNSSIDFFDESKDYEKCSSVFANNNDAPMGDTGNSVLINADTVFVVMNESRRVYKLQLPELKLLASLDLPIESSPRKMVMFSSERAFLTSLTGEELYAFNPTNMKLYPERISVPCNMEDGLIAEGKLFVSCSNYIFPQTDNRLAIIDLASFQVDQFIELPANNPVKLMQWQNQLIVLCSGDFLSQNIESAVVWIDPKEEMVLDQLTFNTNLFTMELIPGALLALHDDGICKIDLNTREIELNYISKTDLVPNSRDLIYALDFDNQTQQLYVTNARFGGQNGELLFIDPFKKVTQRLETGLFPGEVFMYRN